MTRVTMATLILLLSMVTVAFGQQCKVDTFSVQRNFNLEKFAGKWYEVSWIQYYFEPPYDNYLDFVQNYTIVNASYVTAVNSGRVKLGDAECNIGSVSFNVSSSNPAKWQTITRRNGIDYTVDHWIISTDYDNYAFVYGCTRKKQNGDCNNAHAWKWSRTPQLSAQYLQMVDYAARQVCLDPDSSMFVASNQTEDCELVKLNPTSGVPLLAANGAVTLLCVFIWQSVFV